MIFSVATLEKIKGKRNASKFGLRFARKNAKRFIVTQGRLTQPSFIPHSPRAACAPLFTSANPTLCGSVVAVAVST
jgi:hypothetical protein